MNDYYLVRFNMTPCMESETDILAALLGEKNFESFVPDAEGLSAYVKKELYDAVCCPQFVPSRLSVCGIRHRDRSKNGFRHRAS